MYHKIRIAVVSLAIMAICLLSSTSTLSYFTDSDAKTNEFVVGNASTSLTMYSNESGSVFNAADYSPLVGDENNEIDIPFFLSAANNGNIPVYQRFRIAIPIALADLVTINLPAMNDDCIVTTTSENTCSNENYTVTYKPSVGVENVPTYAEYYIVSNDILAVDGLTTKWPTTGIHITGISDANKSLFTCADSSDNNCTLGINVYSDAIQTTGFTDADSAFVNFRETY